MGLKKIILTGAMIAGISGSSPSQSNNIDKDTLVIQEPNSKILDSLCNAADFHISKAISSDLSETLDTITFNQYITDIKKYYENLPDDTKQQINNRISNSDQNIEEIIPELHDLLLLIDTGYFTDPDIENYIIGMEAGLPTGYYTVLKENYLNLPIEVQTFVTDVALKIIEENSSINIDSINNKITLKNLSQLVAKELRDTTFHGLSKIDINSMAADIERASKGITLLHDIILVVILFILITVLLPLLSKKSSPLNP